MMSRNPFVVIIPVFAPENSSIALVTTVVPRTNDVVSRRRFLTFVLYCSAIMPTALRMAVASSDGVVNVLPLKESLPLRTTKSVNVPPTSMPIS